ncbi:hypothetical protein BmHG_00177 [Borrelia miyamotoi]|uniref:DUF58 domain-containing protein n=1 Tax=Borrelia miyamotoi TaxID=47466 RepID=A0AAP9CGC2_9SPIR|nr:DUF58 domain-containing protein [Borrelia miyamotoi]AHH05245.1 Putative cytosolic protein [Borrelia miyamotoi FR64b]ATQ15017.1 DUF58 domain-containing protein [Borrelia miyamotoi]ATQ16199.1 DUF58 domain-containing protein [Borrelia miyamotoi]ATQ17345.1 DUF58 domain-containing protein [Borrelia miyamotoi]ATQ18153.1 DUF58 domain-containing protein [Borrelia miyamotoi]
MRYSNESNATSTKTKIKALKFFSRKMLLDLNFGGYRSIFKGLGLEFYEFRPYEETDDARLIDWNVSSKTDSIFSKVFREDKGMNLHLLVDNSLSMTLGSLTNKKEIQDLLVSIFAHMAFFNNDKIGITFFSSETDKFISSRKGHSHLGLILNETINRKLKRGSNLTYVFKNTAEYYKKRSLIVIISDFKASDYFKSLTVLSKRHNIIAIRLTDFLDENLPQYGFLTYEDIETRENFLISGFSKAILNSYKNYWTLDKIKWRKECIKRGINFIEISTKDDVFRKLKALLKKENSI